MIVNAGEDNHMMSFLQINTIFVLVFDIYQCKEIVVGGGTLEITGTDSQARTHCVVL